MKNLNRLNNIIAALFFIWMLLQVALPKVLLAVTAVPAPPIPLYDFIKQSDLILVAQSSEIVETPANKYLNRPSGGWIRFQVLEIWKGSLKKKSFTMGWGYYDYFGNHNYFGVRKSIPREGKYLMFLKRGYRKILSGVFGIRGFWRIKKIQIPDLEGKSEVVVYRDPVDLVIFPVSGQILLRNTTIKQIKNGKKVYRKAFLLNELRIYIKGIIETLEKTKKPVP